MLQATRHRARRSSFGSESGSILVLTALSIALMLGVAALAVDGSFMYVERNRMAAAADAAAKAAALEYWRNPAADLQAFADREAIMNGFDPAQGASVVVHRPPSSGSFTSIPNYVEVIVSRPTNTFFASILDAIWSSVTPGARAVAGTSPSPNCLVTLNQSGAPSLAIGGTVHLDMPNCSIAANGNMDVAGGGSITAAAIGVQGTCSGCPSSYVAGMPTATDPLAALPVPANPYPTPMAYTLGNNQPPQTLDPGWYSTIDVGSNDTLALNPGVYWVSGPIIIGSSSRLTGSGVFIYLAGTAAAGACTSSSTVGCIRLGNDADVALSAQTSGPYDGVLFFQDRGNATEVSFANTSSYLLSGVMYFPAAAVTLGNAGGSTDCTLFVAYNINIDSGGGSTGLSNTCAAYGGSPILAITLAE